MNIKEVESKTGLKKANIRFYEQQGLLVPERNEKNNYREYGMEDVETLQKIKILRTLEVSIQDIRKLQEGKIFPVVNMGRWLLCDQISDTMAAINMAVIVVLFGIWSYLGDKISKYKTEVK